MFFDPIRFFVIEYCANNVMIRIKLNGPISSANGFGMVGGSIEWDDIYSVEMIVVRQWSVIVAFKAANEFNLK